MDCIGKISCKKKSEENCNKNCEAFIYFEAVNVLSNIPGRYKDELKVNAPTVDYEAYIRLNSIKNNVLEFVEEGKSLYIHSRTTGNGKTLWGCKILNEFIRKSVFAKDFDRLVYFANTSEILEELRLGYEDGNYLYIVEKLKNSKLLLLDDIGAEKSTEWVTERLYDVINYRVNNGLGTVYTSNLPIEDLRVKLGDRIVSRVLCNSKIINLKGKDKRGEI